MVRKLFVAIIAIASAILLLSLMPAHAQQGPAEREVGLLHNTKDVVGSLMPHVQKSPGTGIKAAVRYPIGLAAFSGGFKTATTRLWTSGYNETGMITGHTSIFAIAERHLHPMHVSAQVIYMHKSMPTKRDFFQDDSYTYVLKAEYAKAKTHKPFVFVGMLTPAYVPIQKVIGMGGLGVVTHTEITPSAAIHTNSSIATTLLQVGWKESKTMARSHITLELQLQQTTKVQIGFNVINDLTNEEYHTWWSAGIAQTF